MIGWGQYAIIKLFTNTKMKYIFEKPLIEGIITSRPNRFIMFVKIKNKIHKCHCPSTGKIGNIEFKNIPCLLSESNNPSRKTKFTVEAIYPVKDVCVGINQTKANTYINFFLENNLLKKIVDTKEIRREVKLNTSRIDFFINNNLYLEIKTPLTHLPFGGKVDTSKFNSFERMGRHFLEISSQIEKGKKAIVAQCYMYNAKSFETPKPIKPEIIEIVTEATRRGLGLWQINLKIDKRGVSLIKYFRLAS